MDWKKITLVIGSFLFLVLTTFAVLLVMPSGGCPSLPLLFIFLIIPILLLILDIFLLIKISREKPLPVYNILISVFLIDVGLFVLISNIIRSILCS